MAPLAHLKLDVTLKHRANLGEDQTPIAFKAGDPVQVLRRWSDRALFKDASGLLFTIPNEQIEIEGADGRSEGEDAGDASRA